MPANESHHPPAPVRKQPRRRKPAPSCAALASIWMPCTGNRTKALRGPMATTSANARAADFQRSQEQTRRWKAEIEARERQAAQQQAQAQAQRQAQQQSSGNMLNTLMKVVETGVAIRGIQQQQGQQRYVQQQQGSPYVTRRCDTDCVGNKSPNAIGMCTYIVNSAGIESLVSSTQQCSVGR